MNKLNAMLLGMMMVGTQAAQADGFICQDYDETVKVKVFHNVQKTKGTRTAAVMVFSDPRVNHGRKTIATFKNADGLLTSKELSYAADVDLRYVGSSRKGELIGGTKLGELDAIELEVDFSYKAPLDDAEETDAILHLYKRNGKEIELDMVCARYLKLKGQK